jgi:polyferredoxin
MLTLQLTLGAFTWNDWVVFFKRFIFFSFLVIIIGRGWCGWVCPLGFFQDILDLIRRKIGIGYIRFTQKLSNALGWIKWVFLSVAVLIPIWVAFPLFCPCVALNLNIPYCQLCPGKYILPLLVGNPARVAVNFKNATTVVMSTLGLTFSVATIIGAFVKRRFWCMFCPLGLIMSWYRKISFLKLKKDDTHCTRCEICFNTCPAQIEDVYISYGKKDVTSADCSLCLKCVENCPEQDALQATFLGKTIYRSSPHKFFNKKGVSPESNYSPKPEKEAMNEIVEHHSDSR